MGFYFVAGLIVGVCLGLFFATRHQVRQRNALVDKLVSGRWGKLHALLSSFEPGEVEKTLEGNKNFVKLFPDLGSLMTQLEKKFYSLAFHDARVLQQAELNKKLWTLDHTAEINNEDLEKLSEQR